MRRDRIGEFANPAFRQGLAAVWLGLIVFLIILYLILRFVVLRSFEELETQSMIRNVDRVENAVGQQVEFLSSKSSDWAAWDDAYRFVQDRNERFIRSNIVLSAFTGIDLHLIAYVDTSGNLIYGRWYEHGVPRLMPIPGNVLRAIEGEPLLIMHRDPTDATAGIVMIGRSPMLVASRPVVRSNEQGPIRGSLIFGRLLDSGEVRRLSETTRVSVALFPISRERLPDDVTGALTELRQTGRKVVRPIGRHAVAGYAILDDIRGRPALVLRAEMPSTLYDRGRAFSDYAIAALGFLSLLFGTIVSLLLLRTVQREHEYDVKTRDFYRRTIQAATEGKLLITDRNDICGRAGEPVESWNLVNAAEVSLIREQIRMIALESDIEPEERVDYFIVAAGEAITNALKHAGGGKASIHLLPDGLMLVVADRGPGIPSLALPDVALTRGYSTAGTLGMGYKFMLSMMDCVYLSTGPDGTTVGMVMSFHPSATPSLGLPSLETMMAS